MTEGGIIVLYALYFEAYELRKTEYDNTVSNEARWWFCPYGPPPPPHLHHPPPQLPPPPLQYLQYAQQTLLYAYTINY